MTKPKNYIPAALVSLHDAIDLVGRRCIPNWTGTEADLATNEWHVPIAEEPGSYDPDEPLHLVAPTGNFATDDERMRAETQIRFKAACEVLAEPIAGHRILVLEVGHNGEIVGSVHRAKLLEDAGIRHFIEGGGTRGTYCVARAALEKVLPQRRGAPPERFANRLDKLVFNGVMEELQNDPDAPLEPTIHITMEAIGAYQDDPDEAERAVERMKKRVQRVRGK